MSGHSNPPASVAYSYIRFSHPDQAKGDSLRRQTEAAADWCQRHKVNLDTSTTLHDLGKSAYTGEHRKNPDRHGLAAFLKLVESGKVPRGSYLIIENLDRLSREHIQPALLLALNLSPCAWPCGRASRAASGSGRSISISREADRRRAHCPRRVGQRPGRDCREG
jgi:hypothetical protein